MPEAFLWLKTASVGRARRLAFSDPPSLCWAPTGGVNKTSLIESFEVLLLSSFYV